MAKAIICYILVFCTINWSCEGLKLSNQVTSKPRHTKFSASTTELGSGALVTPTSSISDSGEAYYRLVNINSGTTCVLLKTDAVVEVNFKLHGLEEQADSFVPTKALVDGKCKEDESYMTISWSGYTLVFYFAKTPGGERWYISNIELTANPELPQFLGLKTHGRPIKLYHRKMLIPTPVGKSYTCKEVDVELSTDEEENPQALRGSVLLRLLQVQPFMYKGDNFEEAFECKAEKQYRDETAPIAVGSTLAIAVLMTITGYGIFRYFKIKNVQYNTME